MAQTPKELVDNARKEITEIKPADARERIEQGAVVLDVRDDYDFDAGHIPGALHISRGTLEFRIGNHPATQDPATEILLYCKAGGCAALAAQTLQQLGYTNVVSIAGGYEGWVGAGGEVEGPGRDEEE